MNETDFDRFVRALAGSTTRRSLSYGLVGLSIAAGLSSLCLDDAAAKKRKKTKKAKKKR